LSGAALEFVLSDRFLSSSVFKLQSRNSAAGDVGRSGGDDEVFNFGIQFLFWIFVFYFLTKGWFFM
jgi:hypothetical protein